MTGELSTIGGGWDRLLGDELSKDYYGNLCDFLDSEKDGFYPPVDKVFAAYRLTLPESVKCVILGQDPYHEPGQAEGLAFSVPNGCAWPPSLRNIFKELESDLGIAAPGRLTGWAKQGVFLLNTVLTVRPHEAASHKGRGWERFTDRTIEVIDAMDRPIVFILWGSHAQAKKSLIKNEKHLIIEGVHPSPLSAYRGFFGGKYFSRTNEFLSSKGIEPINWSI